MNRSMLRLLSLSDGAHLACRRVAEVTVMTAHQDPEKCGFCVAILILLPTQNQ
jgi:hypothetical protein